MSARKVKKARKKPYEAPTTKDVRRDLVVSGPVNITGPLTVDSHYYFKATSSSIMVSQVAPPPVDVTVFHREGGIMITLASHSGELAACLSSFTFNKDTEQHGYLSVNALKQIVFGPTVIRFTSLVHVELKYISGVLHLNGAAIELPPIGKATATVPMQSREATIANITKLNCDLIDIRHK